MAAAPFARAVRSSTWSLLLTPQPSNCPAAVARCCLPAAQAGVHHHHHHHHHHHQHHHQQQLVSRASSSRSSSRSAVLVPAPKPPSCCRKTTRRHGGGGAALVIPAAAGAAAAVSAAGGAGVSWLPCALPQLLPASGPWGVWAGLITAGAFGMWCERHTRIGKELSGALVATLAGMALANSGFLPPHPPEVGVVFSHLLPLAIPLLLLSANVVRIVRETGPLLAAFLLGTAATLVASYAAMLVFPLTALGDQGWRVAAALTARHIGGAVNYMAVSEALGISPSIFGAGLAADDLMLSGYFVAIYSLAKAIPPEAAAAAPAAAAAAEAPASGSTSSSSSSSSSAAPNSSSSGGGHGGAGGRVISVFDGCMAVALSGCICYLGTQLAAAWGVPSQAISIITGLTVTLASLAPRLLAPLAPSAEGLALLLMQVFFAAVGASANVGLVLTSAPVLLCFSAVALGGHLLLLLGAGRLLGFSRQELLLASNANIGGPSTVAGMAAAKGWPSQLVPAVLVSSLGYALGTPLGIALGATCLRPLCGGAG